ncbi:protein FAM98A-like [Uloborus diversus]|uniref:protein FAM98A-like n=1 Tax=Uloborus diversus TaxID=327109 RepID=UPI00240A7D49|nr:protein FAM98A-like [Uloborus diversus]
MEKVISDLENFGYESDILSSVKFEEIFNDGLPGMLFVDVVQWLTSQLVLFCQLESHVSPVSGAEDLIGFLVEVSSLLKEMCCPIKCLTRGQVTDRLDSSDNKLFLILYLSAELQAAKMLALKKPKKQPAMKIELAESKTAKDLKQTLIALHFRKPPDSITTQQLFTELQKKLKMICGTRMPKDIVGDLLFSGSLTEKQWFQLEHLYQELYKEYRTRRTLLLTRLDVTIQSFFWADRLKNKSEETMNVYGKKKSQIAVEPSVNISDILASTLDLATIEKTSSASVRKNTKSSVTKVIIGAVPDRGGRPEEQQPPPPEVPSWQKTDSSRGGMKQSYQHNTSNSNFSQNRSKENSKASYSDGQHKRENYNQGYNQGYNQNNYRGNKESGQFNNRGGGDDGYCAPMYQQVQYLGHPVNQQFGGFGGFGGYAVPAGDNFQQYGMADVSNQYASRGSYGSGPRTRGGYSDRGSNQFRGRSRGRGRY